MILNVKIEKRIATLLDSENDLVCGNSGDSIVFAFDAEWDAYPNRTARFKWNGKYHDVEFSGDTVDIPSITDTRSFSVGVYSGEAAKGEEEISTTDVKIPCLYSTRCGDSKPNGESGKYYTNEAMGYAASAQKSAENAQKSAEDAAEVISDVMINTLPVLNLTGDTVGMNQDNAVSLNYEFKGKSGTCTVKWQGSSSIGFPKKNYTVKFDEAFEAKEGWGSHEKYCFKANYVDPSHLRNIVSAKLWGEVVKSRTNANERLNALVNGGAIDGFPCVIKINGLLKGLYTLNIPKDGWMLGMGGGTNECILCANGSAKYASCKFQASEEAFGQGFSLEYITDEENTEWALTSLNSLIASAMSAKTAELDEKIDWDSAIDYYIFSALIGNVDGIVKNYLLSTFDGTKWFFTGYDMDATFGNHPNGQSFYRASQVSRLHNIALNHQMFQIVKVYKTAELKARYEELRNGVLSEDNVCYVMENFAKSIPSEAYSEDRRLWKALSSTSVSNIDQMRDWYRRRIAVIDADINAL